MQLCRWLESSVRNSEIKGYHGNLQKVYRMTKIAPHLKFKKKYAAAPEKLDYVESKYSNLIK
jgi:hypothetical protein